MHTKWHTPVSYTHLDVYKRQEQASSVNVAKASIFACLDLCDERNKALDEAEKLREEVLRLSKKEQDAQDDRKEALALVERLRAEVLDLKISLSNDGKAE